MKLKTMRWDHKTVLSRSHLSYLKDGCVCVCVFLDGMIRLMEEILHHLGCKKPSQ